MLTYTNIKRLIDDCCDYEDLFEGLLITIFTLILDILFLLFQPLLFLIIRKIEKDL